MCGFSNAAAVAKSNCISCGAPLDESSLGAARSAAPGRGEQARFNPLWFLIAIGITSVLTAAIVMGLPLLLPWVDFEGRDGMTVAVFVWLASGILVGLISPGKMFVEPVLATLLVAAPTAFLLFRYQTVKTMPLFMYVLMSALGLLFALVGSYTGERIQMGPPGKPQS